MVIIIYVFSFWGLRPHTLTKVLPLDPAGELLSPVPPVCPPPKQISGYAPVNPTTETEMTGQGSVRAHPASATVGLWICTVFVDV